MKLKIMTTEAISYVKKNIDVLTCHYENGDNPEIWLSEAIGGAAFQIVDGLEFEDFSLLINEETPSASDVFNIKLLYIKLKELNDSFATDERLWAGLAHTIFYEYMLKRWPKQNTSKDILNHYFFNTSRPRCYMINTLARLWWFGKKTYLENEENKFALLDYIGHDINGYGFTLFGSNWSNSERTLKLFFDAIFAFDEETGEKVGRALFNDVMKYANCLSGIYVLDACDDIFITEKFLNYLRVRSEEIKREAEYNRLNNVRTTGVEKLDNIIKALNMVGGHGTMKEIVSAYEGVIQATVSNSLKDYIASALEKNCPDRRAYSGKPMFYWIKTGDGNVWKIANEFLVRDNMKHRKELMKRQIESLNELERPVFNLITAINGTKFKMEDLYQFSQQMVQALPSKDEPAKQIKEAVESMCTKGMLERQDSGLIKKAYAIKIN